MNTRNIDNELVLAVKADQLNNAQAALEKQANPRCKERSLDHVPVIFLATSPEMLELLLQWGADPTALKSTNLIANPKHITLFDQYITHDQFNLISTIVNHQPCILSNKWINETLLKLLSQINKPMNFKRYNPIRNAIVSLIRTSTDLQQDVVFANQNKYHKKFSPFYYAINHERFSDIFVKLMLNNNAILWEEINYNKINIIINEKNKSTLTRIFKASDLTRFLHITNIWQLIQLGQKDTTNILTSLPNDIYIYLIKMTLETCHFSVKELEHCLNYYKQYADMSKQKIAFGHIYSILKNNEKSITAHAFWEKNQHRTPYGFFAKAHKKIYLDSDGLTAKTLRLSIEHHKQFHSDNEIMVSSLVHHCTKDKFSLFTSKKQIKKEIKKQLPMPINRNS